MTVHKTEAPNPHQVLKDLRKVRVAKNMTQVRLAAELGYNTCDISRIERHSRNVSFQSVVDYASYFGFQLALVKTSRN